MAVNFRVWSVTAKLTHVFFLLYNFTDRKSILRVSASILSIWFLFLLTKSKTFIFLLEGKRFASAFPWRSEMQAWGCWHFTACATYALLDYKLGIATIKSTWCKPAEQASVACTWRMVDRQRETWHLGMKKIRIPCDSQKGIKFKTWLLLCFRS